MDDRQQPFAADLLRAFREVSGGAMKTSADTKVAGMSDVAVQKRTGHTWNEWFALLDAAGGKDLLHQEIVAHLRLKYPALGQWWWQMVTVGYEQGRKQRPKHQKPDGFQISKNKTIAAGADVLFNAWQETKDRNKWLGEKGLVIRTSTPNKSVRITWNDGATNIEVQFFPKGANKTQVSVQHNKLANSAMAERMKKYWAEALERLQQYCTAPAARSKK